MNSFKKMKEMKKKLGIASFLLAIVAGIAAVYAAIVIIAAMGAASAENECNTSDSDVGTVKGRIHVEESPKYGQKAMMHIASAVSDKTGISGRLLFAQMVQETGTTGDSYEAKTDHNFGGMTYGGPGTTIGTKGGQRGKNGVEGGNYIHYKNLSDFATEWAKTVTNMLKKLKVGKNVSVKGYAHAMKKAGYYEDTEEHYSAGMEAGAKIYDNLKNGKSKSQGDGNSDSDDSSEENCDEGTTSGKWGWPFKSIPKSGPGVMISKAAEQTFGYSPSRDGNFHDGTDFGTDHFNDQKILAIHGGTVKKIGNDTNGKVDQTKLGWYVWVQSSDGWCEIYQEFAFTYPDKSKIKVHVGQKIKTGDVVGILKNTNGVDHVHIGVTKEKDFAKAESKYATNDGTWKDPVKIIKAGLHNKGNDNSSDGLSGSEAKARSEVVAAESGGNWNAVNGSYVGRYQLTKYYITHKIYGGDGSMSHKNQTLVANRYVKDRYGSWKKALAFRKVHGWY